MSTNTEDLVQREMELNRAREEAGMREHGTMFTAAKVSRIIGWLAPIIPIIGYFGLIFLGFIIPMVCFAIGFLAGAKKFAIKQMLITFVGAIVAGIVWALIYAMGMLAIGVS